jgi:hypothetical protein
LSLLLFNTCVKNALKLAYVHLSVQKIFPGLYPRTPVSKGRGGEGRGKQEGGIRKNGTKRMGRKDEGEREEGGRGKGGMIVN